MDNPAHISYEIQQYVDRIAELERNIAEMQPRDAFEDLDVETVRQEEAEDLEELSRDRSLLWSKGWHGASQIFVVLRAYDAARTELARWNGTHHSWTLELERVKAERDRLASCLSDAESHELSLGKQCASLGLDCARLRESLQLVLPMAKGYAALNPVGSNHEYVHKAEEILATHGKTEGE